MSADPRVQRLLERMLETDESPEAVCHDTPELLDDVRAQWQRLAPLREELSALFPDPGATPHPVATPPPPAQVPGHELEQVLGRGGMGIVYRARHTRLGRTVALKMLLSGADALPTELARFRREAEVLATLRHPNIVQVYDVGEVHGIAWFTMEHLAGGTLAQRTRTHVTARDAATLLATLAAAIDCAHKSGIVHRDLKPSNVLLADDGTPKISDFGLARRIGGVTALTMGGALGTPDYMAPEQLAGHGRHIGPAADVHALGAMLYELLAGQPPFRGPTVAATLRLVLEREPTLPSRRSSRVPRDLETITLKCLQKDPGKRYSSAAELAADLQRFLRHEPIHARRVGSIERVMRWSQRRPAAAALVALAAFGFGYTVVSGIQQQLLAAERNAASVSFASRLDDVDRALAHVDLESADALLGQVPEGLPVALRERAAAAHTALQLVRTLDAIRLERTAIVGGRYDPWQNRSRTDTRYATAFAATPFDPEAADPAVVAAHVQRSSIRRALVAAIDDWALCTLDAGRRHTLLDIAKRSDPDPGGWRDRARDPAICGDRAALQVLADSAPLTESSVQLLTGLGEQMRALALDARPFLLRVQQAFPNDFWANYQLGDTLLNDRREAAEAVRYFQAAMAIRPKVMLARNGLATALMNSGRVVEAIELFRASLLLDPTYAETFAQYAMALHAQRDLPGAEAAYRESIRLDPTRSHVRHNFGNVLRELERNEEAMAEYREASRLEPDNITPRYSIGMMLRLLGRLDEAVEYCEDAVARQPSGGTHYQLGMCYAQLERWADAEREFRRAREVEPTHVPSLPALRNTLLARGKFEQALQGFREYVALRLSGHEDYDGFAELSLFLGHDDDYREACQILVERFENAADPHVLERTGRACLLSPTAPPAVQQRAAAMLDRAVALGRARDGYWATSFFELGKALAEVRLGRPQSALDLLRGDADQALWPAPDLVRTLSLLRLGDRAAAADSYTRAVLGFDWSRDKATSREAWLFHILRRQAETLLVPDLPDLLARNRPANTAHEHAALVAARCFAGDHASATEEFAAVFAARAELEEEVGRRHHFHAACSAARSAASGRPQHAELALHWLRTGLTTLRSIALQQPEWFVHCDGLLAAWQREPALAALRGAAPLPAALADDCAAFWREVEAQREWARAGMKR